VLALVFLDELLAMAAFGVWGWQVPSRATRWLLVWMLPLVAMSTWFFLASPKARYGGTVARPVAKVVVFGLASLALWDAGQASWAWALLGFSTVVNGLATIPAIAALAVAADSGRVPEDAL
jgi:hypothetical protein